jgi:hypothetical protein
MDLAQALIGDAQAMLAVVVSGFWIALTAIAGSALAGLGFSIAMALTRTTSGPPVRRPIRSAWR